MIFSEGTHTDDFFQAHTGRFWRHNLRTHGDICKRSGIRVLFEPPFKKASYKRCLFCWDYGLAAVGALPDFLSIQVLERYLGSKERPFFGPCSLTGNLGGSNFTGSTPFPALQNPFGYQQDS